jgi:predicted amidohydrolase
MTRPLRVAAVQLRCGIDAAANLAHALPLLREAASAGAQLIVTPENTLRLDRDRERLLAAVNSSETDTEIQRWAHLAQQLGVWLLMGSAGIAATPGKIFNRSLLFGPDGHLAAHYDKIHLFDVQLDNGESYCESATVQAGEQIVIARGPADARLGLTICYDLRFPHLYGALAQGGAEIITIPAAFTYTTGQAHWNTLIRARAIETGAFIVAPAQGGRHEDGRTTWGHSLIVDPWGQIIAQLEHNEPGVLVADLDLDRVATTRAKIPAWRGTATMPLNPPVK